MRRQTSFTNASPVRGVSFLATFLVQIFDQGDHYSFSFIAVVFSCRWVSLSKKTTSYKPTVPKIQIVIAPPGPTTTERVGELIQNHPEGITVRELSRQLNRPVSMVQHCLKSLISSGQVYVRLSENGMQRVYYPSSTVAD